MPSQLPLAETEFIQRTTGCIAEVLCSVAGQLGAREDSQWAAIRDRFEPGKLLRTRLALALSPAGNMPVDDLVRCCAATEMIHTATLFHDDVIDGASLRRGQPALWKAVGSTGAILIGDLFFSAAVELVLATGRLELVQSFVGKVREVCATEAVHELLLRGQTIELADSLRIARGKTGALFAFPAEACGGTDAPLSRQLAEVGYLVGTAYQIADDLVDEVGDEQSAGKTLGTDRKRHKFTLAQTPGKSVTEIRQEIEGLGQQALARLAGRPELAARLQQYLSTYLTLPQPLPIAKAG